MMIFVDIILILILLVLCIIPSTEKFRFKILQKLYEDINKKDYILKTNGKGKLTNKLIIHEYMKEVEKDTGLDLFFVVGDIAHGDYKLLLYLYDKLIKYERKEYEINQYKESEE